MRGGFTLIELLVGLVAMGIGLVALSTLVYPLAAQSADPMHQVRATQLARSVMDIILVKPYADSSNASQGWLRCDEVGMDPCTPCGREESGDDPGLFNDVDDYHGLSLADLDALSDKTLLQDLYQGFTLEVAVVCDLLPNAKQVELTVTTPSGQRIAFSAYRYNW